MQSAPVNILSIVVKKIPDGVWLTGLNYNETITVEGIGFSNLNVVAFVENLKETQELQDVYLVESQQTEFEKQAVYRFIVKFRLKV
nr:PilN domain-containing protein [Thermodesulfovibrio thiophilus]